MANRLGTLYEDWFGLLNIKEETDIKAEVLHEVEDCLFQDQCSDFRRRLGQYFQNASRLCEDLHKANTIDDALKVNRQYFQFFKLLQKEASDYVSTALFNIDNNVNATEICSRQWYLSVIGLQEKHCEFMALFSTRNYDIRVMKQYVRSEELLKSIRRQATSIYLG